MSKSSVMNVDSGKKRTVLKDSSWIRRNAEEDEPVDYDPNPGKLVLSQRKSLDNVDSKPAEADKTPVSSGTSISSLTKRYGSSQEPLNKTSSSSTNTKSGAVAPSSPSKPPVPAKNPTLKTPNSSSSSSFTARVFSGANTSGAPLSPVKRTSGEKLPEVTPSRNTNGLKTSSNGAPPPTPPPSVTVPSSPAPSATSTVKSPAVTSPVIQPAVKSSTRSESVSVYTTPSSLVSTSSTSSTHTIITNTKTSFSTLEETPKPVEKPSEDLKLSDASYSSSRSPSAVTVNTRYSYHTPSAPLDDLADTLLPTRIGSIQSQPVRSETQVKTVYSEISPSSPTLRSPLQTLESSRTQVKTVYSEYSPSSPTLESSRTQVKTVYSEYSPSSPTLESSRTQVKTVYSEYSPSSPTLESSRTVYSEIPASSPTLRSPLQTPESSRTVSSRDICTVCGKPIAGSERMILDDLKINSHTSCFRCAACHCDLGRLEAGKSIWVYRERVNCSNCYSKVRGQWYI
ncbi:uncharacterized protein [Garra rufa]|uniref:uncharacterized protein isoform X2 n=1 Tax=Garra rufa TaxID=137080 RepID=UPI003CCE69F2